MEDSPIKDPNVLNAVLLMEEGYHFHSNGKEVRSPIELVGETRSALRTVDVVDPAGSVPAPLAGLRGLEALAAKVKVQAVPCAELDELGPLDKDTADAAKLLKALEAKGVQWTFDGAPQDEALNRVGQMEKLRQGTLRAKLPHRIAWELWYRTEARVATAEKLVALAHKFGIRLTGDGR